MRALAALLLPLSLLPLAVLSLAINPGKYCRIPDLDCLHISAAAGGETAVEYHQRSIETKSTFSTGGGLSSLEVHWDRHRHSQGHLRGNFTSQFTAVNATHLREVVGDSVCLWERASKINAKQKLVEIAVLVKKNPDGTVLTYDVFIHRAFTGNSTPVYPWDGVYGLDACPTAEIEHLDEHHFPSKIIGLTLAHYRVWQEFYRRYRHHDPESRILIVEADVRCSREFCGDLAIEHIQRTDKDILFVGWCRARDSDFSEPPLCSHAYAISVKAAKVLMDNVFPCVGPLDDQMQDLCKKNALTWGTAGVHEIDPLRNARMQTYGLIRQLGW